MKGCLMVALEKQHTLLFSSYTPIGLRSTPRGQPVRIRVQFCSLWHSSCVSGVAALPSLATGHAPGTPPPPTTTARALPLREASRWSV